MVRKRLYYKHSRPDDPTRPTPPAAPPVEPQPPSVQESLRSKLMWWEEVRAWLGYLANKIYESLDKDTDDLTVLRPMPRINDMCSLKWYDPSGLYIDSSELLPMPNAANPSAEQQRNWHHQQQDLGTCSIHVPFYGPRKLPRLPPTRTAPGGMPAAPAPKKHLSADEISTISDFLHSHETQMFKYMDHLDYLLDLIEETLIPEANDNIEMLMNELAWREIHAEAGLPDRALLKHGVVPEESEQSKAVYLAPEEEEDYPDSTYFSNSEEEEDYRHESDEGKEMNELTHKVQDSEEEEGYHHESGEGKEMNELTHKVQVAALSGTKGGSDLRDNEEIGLNL